MKRKTTGSSPAPAKSKGSSQPTGRYAYCPNSGTMHPLFAQPVMRSDKNALYFFCGPPCKFRDYFGSGNPVPNLTREQALAAGAIIPSEAGYVPQVPIPFPVPVYVSPEQMQAQMQMHLPRTAQQTTTGDQPWGHGRRLGSAGGPGQGGL